MFYFWNVDQLVKDLRAGVVTEYEKMRYLFFTAFFQLFSGLSTNAFRPTNPYEMLIKWFFFWILLGILIGGFRYCFLINQKNDNKNFIERFICLGFPISIRLGVYFLLGALIFLALGLLVGMQFIPKAMHAITDASNANPLSIADPAAITASLVAKHGLLKLHVFQYCIASLYSILFFTILGKKIDDVGKADN